jgi:hypothetical protein
MNASLSFRPLGLFGPLLLLLLAVPAPVSAATRPCEMAATSTVPLLFAQEDGTTIKPSWRSRLFTGLNNRTRVVQICVVTMALALLILIKKLTV